MKRIKANSIDEEGKNLFRSLLPGLWVVQELKPDDGEDFRVKPTGINGFTESAFLVQLKSQEKGNYVGGSKSSIRISVQVDRRNLFDYSDKVREPVFIVIADLDSKKAYWMFAQEYLDSNTCWRKKSKPTISIPVADELSNIPQFINAFNSSLRYMENKYPGSIEASIKKEVTHLKKLDPRIQPEISFINGQKNVTLCSNESFNFKMQVQGGKNEIDNLLRGLPANLKILKVDNFPIFAEKLPAEVLFLNKGETDVSVALLQFEEFGKIIARIDSEHGKLITGPKETRLSFKSVLGLMEISNMILSSEIILNPEATINFHFLKIWTNCNISSLPYFDFFYNLFKLKYAKLIMEIRPKDGSAASKINLKGIKSSDNDFVKGMEYFLNILQKLREISENTGIDFVFSYEYNREDIEAIEYLHALIKGNCSVNSGTTFKMNFTLKNNPKYLQLCNQAPSETKVTGPRYISIFGTKLCLSVELTATHTTMTIDNYMPDAELISPDIYGTNDTVHIEKLLACVLDTRNVQAKA